MSAFATIAAHQLAIQPQEQRWMIDQLWSQQAVGIVGGEPKCCKSFLGLEMAVAVASGGLCLGRFAALQTGSVLLHAAEDAQHVVRERLDGIARTRGAELSALDIRVVTAPSVRLDLEQDREALAETVAALRPVLLILDPFVRLHRCDENQSAEVAPLLAFLRELQRTWQTAVVLVHHAKKGAGRLRAGQALRGSGELHAWGDSNLYLRRKANDESLSLTVEHRAAKAAGPFEIALDTADPGRLALQVSSAESSNDSIPPAAPTAPSQQVLNALGRAARPLTLVELRAACQIRTQRVCAALAALVADGQIRKTAAGYELAPEKLLPLPAAPRATRKR
jgi:hypothetical protein